MLLIEEERRTVDRFHVSLVIALVLLLVIMTHLVTWMSISLCCTGQLLVWLGNVIGALGKLLIWLGGGGGGSISGRCARIRAARFPLLMEHIEWRPLFMSR